MAFLQRLSSDRASTRSKVEELAPPVDGGGCWLDAHYDPVASLYTFSSCMALEDLNHDGDHKLLVGDLGSGHFDMKLKVYKGTELSFDTPLLNLPTAVCTFYMDNTEPRTPAVAVASGSFIYIYKNLRPYFKFTLPHLQLNSTESDLWEQVKSDKIDPLTMREVLENMNSEVTDVPLTVRSLKFLQLDHEDLLPFTTIFKHVPLKRQTVITCMATMKKSHVEDDAVSCLVVGTENKDIYILDPEAFTVLAKLSVPAVPVFLSVAGLYDVEYQVSVATRDACIYTIKGGGRTPKYRFSVGSQPCGMQRLDKDLVVGCMDNTLSCFTVKGKRLWVHKLPDAITLVEKLDYKTQGVKGVIVALRNMEVRIYRGKSLINTLQLDDIVMGLKFGQFGREDGSLLMITQGGSLIIKILKRTAPLEVKDIPGPPKAQGIKLNLPKKTKIIVDQTVRERENFMSMHDTFQKDLFRLKLETARSYCKAISASLAPVITAQGTSLKISAWVQGLGPVFRLTVSIQNTAPSALPIDLFITFKCDESLYRIQNKLIELPMLVPQLNYSFETRVESLDDMGRAEDISVFVLKKGNPIPLITAMINMPLSENVIIV